MKCISIFNPDKKTTCDICGKYHKYGWVVEGVMYCKDCFNNMFTTCDHCGDTVKKEDAEFVKRDSARGNNSFLCKKCAKRDFVLPYHYNYPDIKFFGDSKNNSVPYE